MKLSSKARDELPDSDFAVPGKRKLPIHDRNHVKGAWELITRTKGLTEEEILEGRKRILARAEKLGLDTSKWMNKPKSSNESLLDETYEHLNPIQRRIRQFMAMA